MVERVEKVVLEDHQLSVENIASKVGISVGYVHTILHEDLRMRKMSSRWVPRMLADEHKAARMPICQVMLTHDESMNGTFFSSIVTMDETWMPFFNPETKRQSAQWKHTHSPPPKKFRVSTSVEKMMLAMFWDSDGVILTHCVPKGTTLTGASYQDVLKNKLHPALREKRPEKAARVLFHQDNAPAHRAYAMQQFLREHNLEVVSHAPYSPDLAPSDFWLFPTMKDTLRGRTFTSCAAIASVIFQWSKQTPTETFAATMESRR
ncbi:hypothetical protein B7P43_G16600 [Cryptotermes secundus]|uniref:Mariner Mos1 transposase n=1 Tax=Cryptotermes secundus TaxID=105785 RepID=A0A2J7Q2R0_9NEOP|nr:hypothetical protein B7P43_G16600 [Cryptotermes secundus]